MQIFRSFSFDAAHRLPKVPEGHKCSNLHGHTFKIELYLSGEVSDERGWIVDFSEIKKIFKPLLEQLDHHYLNDIEGLENPTSENIAVWIWEKVKPKIPLLCKIIVMETPQCGAVYEGKKK